MAEESGVSEAGLKAKITEQLQATHVEIEDMSGIFYPTMPLHVPASIGSLTDEIHRWLRSSIFCSHSITAI